MFGILEEILHNLSLFFTSHSTKGWKYEEVGKTKNSVVAVDPGTSRTIMGTHQHFLHRSFILPLRCIDVPRLAPGFLKIYFRKPTFNRSVTVTAVVVHFIRFKFDPNMSKQILKEGGGFFKKVLQLGWSNLYAIARGKKLLMTLLLAVSSKKSKTVGPIKSKMYETTGTYIISIQVSE